MQRFTGKIVGMMKQENLYASHGGPIILSQIENEYGNFDGAYGSAAKSYINWVATMATSLDTGVPWVMCQQKGVMCQQKDAPDPIPPRFDDKETAERVASPGVSVGLVWTAFGGEVQFVEATAMVRKGEFHLTGQLGDVIKESAQIALTWDIDLQQANARGSLGCKVLMQLNSSSIMPKLQ